MKKKRVSISKWSDSFMRDSNHHKYISPYNKKRQLGLTVI